MTAIRSFAYSIQRHPALTGMIIVALSVILAGCTNGGSSGSGY
jgi:protein-S-isoprenylcysteine O-methyltransferase Ste14